MPLSSVSSSQLNDASGLVLFRFAIAAAATGAFSTVSAVGTFVVLASQSGSKLSRVRM